MGETSLLLRDCENQVWVANPPPPPPTDKIVVEKINPYAGMWVSRPYFNKRDGAAYVHINSLKYGTTSTTYARYLVTKALGRHLVWTRDLKSTDPDYVHEVAIHLDGNSINNTLSNLAIRSTGKGVTPVLTLVAMHDLLRVSHQLWSIKEAEATKQAAAIAVSEPTATAHTDTVNIVVQTRPVTNYTIFTLMIKWGHTYQRSLAKLRKSNTRVFEQHRLLVFTTSE